MMLMWLYALLVLLVLTALVRWFISPFSPRIRRQITQHPFLHILWGVVAIGVLVVLFTPMIRTCPPHNVGRAHAEVHAIDCAIQTYYSEYAYLPLLKEPSGNHVYEEDYEELMLTLGARGVDTNDNWRSIVFLELPVQQEGVFLDSWGNPFNVVADGDYDGSVQVGTSVLKRVVAIWSIGRNGINEFGSGDDIACWRD